MATQVKLLAVLFAIFGVFGLVGAVFSSIAFGALATVIGLSDAEGGPIGGAILGLTGVALMLLQLLLAVPSLIAAYGIWNLRPWGRVLGIILGIFSLIQPPVGTVFGIYALFVLFKQETEALFGR